jgi:hypothetical protein
MSVRFNYPIFNSLEIRFGNKSGRLIATVMAEAATASMAVACLEAAEGLLCSWPSVALFLTFALNLEFTHYIPALTNLAHV